MTSLHPCTLMPPLTWHETFSRYMVICSPGRRERRFNMSSHWGEEDLGEAKVWGEGTGRAEGGTIGGSREAGGGGGGTAAVD